MDLYRQEPEVLLLGTFLAGLENRSVIDVGAERGAFAEAMLAAGARHVHAIEPEPDNAGFIRGHFQDDDRITVLEYAIGAEDGELELHRSVDATGAVVTFGHTVLERPGTDEIAWPESVPVKGRSLASLIRSGELPKRVGILKIDTEGNDHAVVSGLGEHECDVVMVEHWRDLPNSLGTCPWTAEEMCSAVAPHGFSQFAFVEHCGEFVILKWNDAEVARGCMGNLVFLHDRVVTQLLPDVIACASRLADQAVDVGQMYAQAAAERLAVIEGLQQELDKQTDGGTLPVRGVP